MRYVQVVIGALLLLFLLALFARVIDAAMEIDDLKSQVRLQKEAIAFLEAVNDSSLSSCAVKVTNFEVVVKSSSYLLMTWDGDSSLVGPYRIKKHDACITEIKLVGLP